MFTVEKAELVDDFIGAIRDEDTNKLMRVFARAIAYLKPDIQYGETKDGQTIIYMSPDDMEVEENV